MAMIRQGTIYCSAQSVVSAIFKHAYNRVALSFSYLAFVYLGRASICREDIGKLNRVAFANKHAVIARARVPAVQQRGEFAFHDILFGIRCCEVRSN